MRSSLFLAASLASIAAANPSPGIADARGLVHDALWGSMASISSQPQTLGWPFNNIVSFADGTTASSTGVPYMIVSPLDDSVQDYLKNPQISLSLTAAQLNNSSNTACSISAKGDPEAPPCTRLTLTGNFVNISGTDEAKVAMAALYERHPDTKNWGPGSGFHGTRPAFHRLSALSVLHAPCPLFTHN